MRILALAACAYPLQQGTQLYIRGAHRALGLAGLDVSLLAYGHGDGPREPGVLPGPRLPGYRRTRSGPDPVKPLLDAALLARLLRFDGDVVLAHHYEALAIALAARRRTGIPVVYVAHTFLEDELPTYARHGRGGVAALGALADRTLPARADRCVALSPAGEARLRALGCQRVTCVPPGLWPEDVRGVVPRRLGPGPTLVYAGTPDRFQDLHILYAAMRALPDVRLLVVSGAGDWDVGSASVVRTRTWAEAREWIAGADVGVVSRARCGGFPMKLLNYLGLGLPTVVTTGCAAGLPGEVVVAPDDPAALEAGIRSALQADPVDPERILELAGWDRRVEALARAVTGADLAASAAKLS